MKRNNRFTFTTLFAVLVFSGCSGHLETPDDEGKITYFVIGEVFADGVRMEGVKIRTTAKDYSFETVSTQEGIFIIQLPGKPDQQKPIMLTAEFYISAFPLLTRCSKLRSISMILISCHKVTMREKTILGSLPSRNKPLSA